MDILTLIVVGLIVAAGIWIHKVGWTKARAEAKSDLAKAVLEIKSHINSKP